MKKHNMSREKTFENELAHVAAILKCAYIKIPDPIITVQKAGDRKNFVFTETKRPFDGILVTPTGNYCIECKYNYTPLAQHQIDNLDAIDTINGMAYVLRKIEKFDDTGYKRLYIKYRIQKQGETIYETDSPIALITCFADGNVAQMKCEKCGNSAGE